MRKRGEESHLFAGHDAHDTRACSQTHTSGAVVVIDPTRQRGLPGGADDGWADNSHGNIGAIRRDQSLGNALGKRIRVGARADQVRRKRFGHARVKIAAPISKRRHATDYLTTSINFSGLKVGGYTVSSMKSLER